MDFLYIVPEFLPLGSGEPARRMAFQQLFQFFFFLKRPDLQRYGKKRLIPLSSCDQNMARKLQKRLHLPVPLPVGQIAVVQNHQRMLPLYTIVIRHQAADGAV